MVASQGTTRSSEAKLKVAIISTGVTSWCGGARQQVLLVDPRRHVNRLNDADGDQGGCRDTQHINPTFPINVSAFKSVPVYRPVGLASWIRAAYQKELRRLGAGSYKSPHLQTSEMRRVIDKNMKLLKF